MSKGKYTSGKRTSRKRGQNKPSLPFLVSLGGLLLLLWGAYSLWDSRQLSADKVPIEVTGSPSLKVDRELIDLGDVPLNKTVSVTFHLTNVGDKTLRFSQPPYVEVLEGC